MVTAASRADVVFFGEEHDDPETHRAEAALLERIGRQRKRVVLSLEMFERDVQPVVDEYISGRTTESAFLAASRPWTRYVTDYRALVELARARGWPVVAANVPRALAAAVGRRGLAALDSLTAAERGQAAAEIVCPVDAYRGRFLDEMKHHSSGSGPAPAPGDTLPTAVAERFYLAQCVKDETMGEAVAGALRRAGPDAIVVHFDGAFHSDFRQGTVERFRRRMPNVRFVVISAIPVDDPAASAAGQLTARADFVIFTRKAPAPRSGGG
jgi:uncharacterized iron-regulated protein